jgi:phage-related baseplate assembly protein
MLIPGQNRLADPEIVEVPPFEEMLANFKAATIAHVAESDPAMAEKVRATLESEPEVFTKLVEAATVMLQTERRHRNEQIKQMLAWWAEGSNLDAKVADLGLQRQTITEGDPAAFPPVPAEKEDDERLRLRYFLAPHAPAAGSRLHYRAEALTLGDRALVTVETPETGEVVIRYKFAGDTWAAQVRDAKGVRTGVGEVTVAVLGRDGDGTPSAELLEAQRAHFARNDVRPETDDVIVKAASILPYEIAAIAYIHRGPDSVITKGEAEKRLQRYVDEQHHLSGIVDPSWIYHHLHKAGAVRVGLISPLTAIIADWDEAPFCELLTIEVRYL